MNPYQTLNVPRDATESEIKKAYRKRAADTHPDKGGDRTEFERVQAAYELLSDPERRAHFDSTGDTGRTDVPKPEAIAKRAFADAMMAPKPRMDYLQSAIAILGQKRRETRKVCENLEQDIGIMEHTRKHLRRNTTGVVPADPSHDPIGTMLDDDLAIFRDRLSSLRTWLVRFDQAIAILRTYRFELPTALRDAGTILTTLFT